MMRTRGGRYRHQIAIESKAGGKDASGQPSGSWSNVATLRAHVEATTGTEKWLQDLSLGGITHVVSLRYYPSITRKHRLVWNSRNFNIEAVIPDDRNRGMKLMCKEKV